LATGAAHVGNLVAALEDEAQDKPGSLSKYDG
jgi:hypothetical protein